MGIVLPGRAGVPGRGMPGTRLAAQIDAYRATILPHELSLRPRPLRNPPSLTVFSGSLLILLANSDSPALMRITTPLRLQATREQGCGPALIRPLRPLR